MLPPNTPIAKGGKTNTCNSLVVPIIVIPGVMGTRLSRNNAAFWDPNNTDAMKPLFFNSSEDCAERLAATNNAQVTQTPAQNIQLSQQEIARGWAGPAWAYYGIGSRALANANWGMHDCTVYSFGYDWRQSNAASARLLAARIDEILKEQNAEKVILVTHSMGGLVARAACNPKQTGIEDKVLGIIHVTQPAVGATVAYRRFHTGARSDSTHGDGDSKFTRILGNTRKKYAIIGHGLRGPYELLPTNNLPGFTRASWLSWDNKIQSLVPSFSLPAVNKYDVYRDSTGLVGLANKGDKYSAGVASGIRAGIDGAEKFHKILDLYIHKNTYVISSSGLATDMNTHLAFDEYVFGKDGEAKVDMAQSGRNLQQGDGTVPITSANRLAVPVDKSRTVQGVAHADAMNNGNVINNTIEFIRDMLKNYCDAIIKEKGEEEKKKFYTVVKDDNAWQIAIDHGISLEELKALNPGKPRSGDWKLIYPKEVFRIKR